MSLNQWNTAKIKMCKKITGQALLQDEQTLAAFSQDFGKLIQSHPSAVCAPENIDSLQKLILFASQHKVPITIRGNGLSQSGQSLAQAGGLVLSMHHFNKALAIDEDSVWVEANSTWANLLALSLTQQKAPFILPYNCNLSVAGVLSAGGIGASSFKYGAINAYVKALEVIDGLGVKEIVDSKSLLFNACLSGQGRFGVITKACIQLRPILPRVKTFCFVYANQQQWFLDITRIKEKADYIESFCSPSIQGTQLKEGKRVPMTEWLYGLHVSFEYDEQSPQLQDIIDDLRPWKVISEFDEPISSYLLRHNSRFELMKMLGQWDLYHPWYECYIPERILRKHLPKLLQEMPVNLASFVHVVHIARKTAGFLMFPEDESVCSLMILNPGVPEPLKESAIQLIQDLDECLLNLGGKRYLSGFIGKELPETYWQTHFGVNYDIWVELKKNFDPIGIFSSVLHPCS